MFLQQVLVLSLHSSNLLSQRVVISFFSKSSQRYTRYSSFWDSLSSSILKILCQMQSISLSRAHQFQKASSQRFSVARFVQSASRLLGLVVSVVQSANQFLQSISTVRFSWANQKIFQEYFNHFKKKWFFLFIRVILII